MNKPEDIIAMLNSDEITGRLREIDATVLDFEEQGYQAAPLLMQMAGIDPEKLMLATVMAGEPEGPLDNVKRTIGVIRWCLDQRRNG